MRKDNAEKHYTGLRTKMFFSFALFSVIVLAALWLFQIVLLDDIYRSLKLHELEKCADQLSETLMEAPSYDSFDEAAGELAKNTRSASPYMIFRRTSAERPAPASWTSM